MSSKHGCNGIAETGCQQPETHRLCANGCGFFGTAVTLNLCSKCYSDFRNKEEEAMSATTAVQKSLNLKSYPETTIQQQSISTSVDSASSSTPSNSVSIKSDPSMKNRCGSCNKRIGLTGFKCKCGNTFCGVHRYPEKHDCTFDFQTVGRDTIAKANPVVKADKRDWL